MRGPLNQQRLPLRYVALAGLVSVGLIFSGSDRFQTSKAELEQGPSVGQDAVISQRADTGAAYGTTPLPSDRSTAPAPVVNMASLAPQTPAPRDCVDELQEMAQVFTIWFEDGGMAINEQGRDMLRMVGTKASTCPQARVIVGGHAYAASNDAENRRISWNRADAALDVLRALQLDAANIEPRGFGAERPYAQGDAGEDAENRRIDFQVIRGEGAGN